MARNKRINEKISNNENNRNIGEGVISVKKIAWHEKHNERAAKRIEISYRNMSAARWLHGAKAEEGSESINENKQARLGNRQAAGVMTSSLHVQSGRRGGERRLYQAIEIKQ